MRPSNFIFHTLPYDLTIHYISFQLSDDESVVETRPLYAAKFNAAYMVNHFNTICKTYNLSLKSLLHCMCAGNTEVNRKCENDAGVPHLPCKNHTHALDIGKLDKSDAAISKHCSEIREILTTVKASTVESGILCQVTELKPRVVKSCKCQANVSSCDRFGRLFT